MLQSRRNKAGAAAWADGDTLTFAWQGTADDVRVNGGLQLPLGQVAASDWWAASVWVRDLARGALGYEFAVRRGEAVTTEPGGVWRGLEAPPPPRSAEPLRGSLATTTLRSAALGANRDITLYAPPGHDRARPTPTIYLTDGEALEPYARVLEPLITDGILPPALLVGVHSGGAQPPNLRSQEYLAGQNPERFAAHERFFVEEVAAWAETTLGASPKRSQRVVAGSSNGGAFAAQMAARHPERFVAALCFSVAGGAPPLPAPGQDGPRYSLVAGTLEPALRDTTAAFAGALAQDGFQQVYRERVCGHDPLMWIEEFPEAVRWTFMG